MVTPLELSSCNNIRFPLWRLLFSLCLFWSVSFGTALVAPKTTATKTTTSALVKEFFNGQHGGLTSSLRTPVTNTVLFLPPGNISNNVTFYQKATSTWIAGYSNLLASCQEWERNFQSENENDYVEMNLRRVSMVSPTTLLVQWNITWIPPTAMWLQGLAHATGWTPNYVSYTDLSGSVSTFSYKAVAKLFRDAIVTQTLRIPLACIEGTTTCEIRENVVQSMTEDLAFAEELQRGILQNRKCGQDLQLFLETARRFKSDGDWDDVVATCLPWSRIPGINSMDIEPNADDEALAPFIFLGVAALIWVGFVNTLLSM